ncbi:MAG TPA: hypothetical protein VGD60_00740 [Candidatus Acidoferrales bacterium]
MAVITAPRVAISCGVARLTELAVATIAAITVPAIASSQSIATRPVPRIADQADIEAEIVLRTSRVIEPLKLAVDADSDLRTLLVTAPAKLAIAALSATAKVRARVSVADQADTAAAKALSVCLAQMPANELIDAAIARPVCLVVDPAKVDIAATRDFPVSRRTDPENELIAAFKALTKTRIVSSVADQADVAAARTFSVCFVQLPANELVAAARPEAKLICLATAPPNEAIAATIVAANMCVIVSAADQAAIAPLRDLLVFLKSGGAEIVLLPLGMLFQGGLMGIPLTGVAQMPLMKCVILICFNIPPAKEDIAAVSVTPKI